MSKYIEIDALKERIRKKLGIRSLDYLLPIEKEIVKEVDSAPTIDIVHCHECKRLTDCRGDSWQTSVINKGYIGWCNRTSRLGDVDYVKEYDFCSYGERECE